MTDKTLYYDKNGESYAAFDLTGLLFFNYYIGYLSILTHLTVHAFLLGMWCSYSKIIILYSFQVFLLHAYSWAIPDRRYETWIKQRRFWFYGLSGCNILFYACSIIFGFYLYLYSKDGMMQYMGASLLAYTFLSQTLMVFMFSVNYVTLRTRFAKERTPYHGHVEYPPAEDQKLVVVVPSTNPVV